MLKALISIILGLMITLVGIYIIMILPTNGQTPLMAVIAILGIGLTLTILINDYLRKHE